MKCDEITQEIVPYYFGELKGNKKVECKRHLMICRNCARLAYKVRQSMEFIDKNKAPIKKV
ncbi:MAG: zf-HC2 domain-containing protein, partial [Elusimicrobiota bacterium]|nr:zf-HC2 domain-containing protein [Elusimicrobiota bacterium]